MKTFIIVLLVVYILYYAVIIVYDLFVRKDGSEKNSEQEFVVPSEGERRVSIDDIGFVPDGDGESRAGNTEVGGKEEGKEINIINGRVEHQGIEAGRFVEMLLTQKDLEESKSMFSGINF